MRCPAACPTSRCTRRLGVRCEVSMMEAEACFLVLYTCLHLENERAMIRYLWLKYNGEIYYFHIRVD